MDRRRFHHALACTAAAAWSGTSWAQTAVVEPDPTGNSHLTGIRSVLEVSVHNTFTTHKDAWPPTMLQHLKDSWANWLRFGPPKISEGSPWHRYEAFESLARYASKHIWDLAQTTLLVDVHLFNEADLDKLRKSANQKLTEGNWLTAVFERKSFDRLHHRVLGEVVELHLAWLLDNRDRYPRNPAARHAQIEAEDWEICSRVSRALAWAIYDAMAEEERRLRKDPDLAGTNVPMRAALVTLGPAPSGALPRVKHEGASKDPLQPADRAADPSRETATKKR